MLSVDVIGDQLIAM